MAPATISEALAEFWLTSTASGTLAVAVAGGVLVLALRPAHADHGHHHARLDEGVGHLLRLVVQPAGIAPQVHDDALDLLPLEEGQSPAQVALGVGRETDHAEVADLGRGLPAGRGNRQHARRRVDGGRADEVADDGELLRRRRTGPLDVDVHRRAHLAAQPVHRLLQGHVDGGLVVDADDVVLGLEPGAHGRGVRHGLLDRDAPLAVHLDDDAQPAELALGGGAHVLVAVHVEQDRVRIQCVEHAVGGGHLDLHQVAGPILGRPPAASAAG